MNNILYIFIILFPIVDIFTSFNIRYNLTLLSPSIIIRGIFLLYCLIYTIKRKEKILMYYFISLMFFIIYILLRINSNISAYSLIIEIKTFIKMWYFPITLIFFNTYKMNKNKLNKSIKISTFIYMLGIIIPLITNTYFNSYKDLYKGIVGWYYSANEIGTILSSTLILLYLNLNNVKDKLTTILILLNIFTLTLIGTKVSLLSIIIITTSIFLIYYIKDKKNIKIPLMILIISIILITLNNTSYDILKRITPNVVPVFKNNDEIINTSFINKVLSGRDTYLLNTYYNYKNANIVYKLLGMGFAYNNRINTTEMDLFDILFGFGIIGIIIYFIPLIYYIIKNIHIKLNINNLICILGFTLIFIISILSGHTLSAPAVSIYLSIIISLKNKNSNIC